MRNESGRLSPNEDEVAVEVLQGEAVLINLRTGHYYSMDKVAADVWQLIERRASIDAIVQAVAVRWEAPIDTVRADVTALVDELIGARLARLVEASVDDAPPQPAELGPSGRPYEAPRLHTYSDMADMLALDPPLPGIEDIPWKG